MASRKQATVAKPKGAANQARWNEILDEAGALFATRGYDNATMRDIAEAVGMLNGSLYYYIDSKEDLLYGLLRRAHDRRLPIIEAPSVCDDAVSRLAHFIRQWMERVVVERPWGGVADREFRKLSPERLAEITIERRRIHDHVRAILADGIAEGVFDDAMDPAVAANSIFELLNGTFTWFREDGRVSAEALIGWYQGFVLRGLGVPT